MKRTPIIPRKHGFKARAEARLLVQQDADTREAGLSSDRLTTQLTFASDCQAYLWITDRGRSRLIKH